MNPFRIIPAIDLLDGEVVRLYQGDYNQPTKYPIDPVDLARKFIDGGLRKLHVVDLQGARSGSPTQLDLVSAIAGTGIAIELGGGIRTASNIQQAIDAGAGEVILGTSLLENEAEIQDWIDRFGSRIVAAVDSRDGHVAIRGWVEETSIVAVDLLSKLEQLGFARAIVTDIVTDGALTGPNLSYLRRAATATGMSITASGGIATVDDLRAVADLASLGVDSVIVGRAYYEGAISIAQMVAC